MSDVRFQREAVERLEEFLADHANEQPSLSVEVIARYGEGWDFSLESLRDIAAAARAAINNGTSQDREA